MTIRTFQIYFCGFFCWDCINQKLNESSNTSVVFKDVVYQYLIEIFNMLSINAYLTSFFYFSGPISLYCYPIQNNFSMLYEFISSRFYFLTVVSLKHIFKD